MSDFSKFQETQCIKTEIQPVVSASICPDCTPVESYVEPNIYEEKRPNFYLNQKTCEYVVVFDADKTLSQITKAYSDSNSKLKDYLEKHKRGKQKDSNLIHGIRLLLANYSKMEADQYICMAPECAESARGDQINTEALELFARAEIEITPALVEAPIIKVSVPKAQLDAVPNAPEETNEELATANLQDGSNQIEFKTEEIYGMFLRLQWSLTVFHGFYKTFMAVDKGFVHWIDKPSTPINPNVLLRAKEDVKKFRQTLKDVIREKGYYYGIFLDLPFTTRVERVRIKFDNSDSDNLYKVKSIHVKPPGCRWRMIHRERPGKEKFKVFKRGSININAYVADLYNLDDEIQAYEPPSWHEFMVSHTYPRIKVNYAQNVTKASNPQSALGCAIDKWANMGDILDNIGSTFEDIFELYAFAGKRNCDQSLEDMKFKDEYWSTDELLDPDNRFPPFEVIKKTDAPPAKKLISEKPESPSASQMFEEAQAAIKQEKLDELDTKMATKYDEDIAKWSEEYEAYAKKIVEWSSTHTISSNADRRELDRLIEKRNDASKKRDKFIRKKQEYEKSKTKERQQRRKDKIEQEKRWRKGTTKAILRAAKQRALQEEETDDSAFLSLKRYLAGEFGENNFPKGKEEWLEVIQNISLCEFNFIAGAALRCLMGGMSFEKALPKLMQSMMKTMSVRHLPKLLEGLPLETQREIQEKVQKKIGEDVPNPWADQFNSGESKNKTLSEVGANPDFEESEDQKKEITTRSDRQLEKQEQKVEELIQEHQRLHYRYVDAFQNSKDFFGGSLNTARKTFDDLMNHKRKLTRQDIVVSGGPVHRPNSAYDAMDEELQTVMLEDAKREFWYTYEGFPNEEIPYEPATTGQTERQERREQSQEERQDARTERKESRKQAREDWREADKGFAIDNGTSVTYGFNLSTKQREQSAFGGKFNDITGIIVQAYVDAILESVEIEYLLKQMDRFPIVNLVKEFLLPSLRYCPTAAPPFALNASGILKGSNVSVCDPTFMITLPKIPKIKIINIGKLAKDKLKDALTEIIVNLISDLIRRWMNLIDGIVCQGLAALGDAGVNAILGNNDHFNELLGNALCGSDDPRDVAGILDDLANQLDLPFPSSTDEGTGIGPDGFPTLESRPSQKVGRGDCLAATIQSVTSRREIMDLLSGRPKDPRVIERITRAVNLVCASDGEEYGDDFIPTIIDGLSSLIPPDIKLDWRYPDEEEDCPIVETICLTTDEQDAWDKLRQDILSDFGLDPSEAASQIEGLNEKVLDELGVIADALTLGADGLLDRALDQAYRDGSDAPSSFDRTAGTRPGSSTDHAGPLPGCEDPNRLSALPFDPSTVEEVTESPSDFIFSQIERSYRIDMTGRRNSVLNRILSDTEGNSYTKHLRKRKNLLTKFFYWDSIEQEEQEDPIPFDFWESRGYFPLTIGASLRIQTIDSQGNYETSNQIEPGEAYAYRKGFLDNNIVYRKNFLPRKKADCLLEWTPSQQDGIIKSTNLINQDVQPKEQDYSFPSPRQGRGSRAEPETIPAIDFEKKQNFDYLIQSMDKGVSNELEEENFQIMVPKAPSFEVSDLVESLQIDSSNLSYRVKAFNKLFEQKLMSRGFSIDDSSLFDRIYSNIFKFTKNAMVSNMSDDDLNLKNLTTIEIGEEVNDVKRKDLESTLSEFESFAEESSPGFLFGYVPDDLSAEDFEYVGPDGEEYTYKNEEKVLGKTAGGDGRLLVLDPEIHGGSYVRPKIYVKPLEPTGWLRIYKMFSTPDFLCNEQQDDKIVGFGQLKERINKLKRSLNEDKRLYQDPECTEEIPFDKMLGKESHALMDGVVRLIIRMYSLSVSIQIMPILSNVYFRKENFDSFIPRLIMKNMKEDMIERPRRNSFLKVGSHKYWYLFLEQACQAFYREVEFGERIPTAEEQLAINRIKLAQAFYEFPDAATVNALNANRIAEMLSEGITGTLQGREQELELKGREITLDDLANKNLSVLEFYLYALAFREHQDAIFSSNSIMNIKLKTNPISRKILQHASKILLIRIMEKEALTLASSLIASELELLSGNLSEQVEPTIFDFKKMMLSRAEMFKGSSLRLGTFEIERERATNRQINVGDVADVVLDPRETNIFQNSGLDALFSDFTDDEPSPEIQDIIKNGQFFIEKYIRVNDRELSAEDSLNDARQSIANRSNLMRGVVPIGAFKDYLRSLQANPVNPDRDDLISDFFGDLEFTYDEYNPRTGKPMGEPTGIKGETGLSYGLRISYMPPASFAPRLSNVNFDPELTLREKSFNFVSMGLLGGSSDDPTSEMTKFAIPLASAEIPLVDESLKQFTSENSVNKLDLECLVNELIKTPEFQLLFDNCFSLSQMTSFVSAHVYSCFLDSIGDVDGWAKGEALVDDDDTFENWDGKILDKTKGALRRVFAGVYNSQDFEDEEAEEDKKSFDELFKLMNPFRGLLNLGSLGLNRWALRRLVFDNPFDEEGEECTVELRDLLK